MSEDGHYFPHLKFFDIEGDFGWDIYSFHTFSKTVIQAKVLITS